MLKVTLSSLFVISLGLVSGGGSDLPPYIPKCSLSDPKFSECVIQAANQAIPIIAKGDPFYYILPLSPLAFAKAPVHATGLEYVLYDVYTDNWKTLVLTDARMDFKNGKASFVGALPKIQAIAQNYTIIDGKILDIPVYGHGKYNATLVGVKIILQGSLRFYKKGNDDYLDYFDFSSDSEIEYAHFYFENMKSPEKSDVNAYINENWKNFFNQLKPAFNSYIDLCVNAQIKTIFDGVPFNKIFLP